VVPQDQRLHISLMSRSVNPPSIRVAPEGQASLEAAPPGQPCVPVPVHA